VLVGLVRTGPPAPRGLRALVQAAFAHRRKALARSVQLAAPALGPSAPADLRAATRAALEALGHPADARAERLTPGEFRALHAALTR
jgi:16S rRNA (adenine1518-N6/adenine1519-N6)-dimethyltransferase